MNPSAKFLHLLLATGLLGLPFLPDAEAGPTAKPTKLSGVVFNDTNENAVQDEDETPAMGIVVDLLDADARFVSRELTGEDGVYSFEGIDPGVYFLRFEFMPGFVLRSRGIEVGLNPASGGKTVVSGKNVISGKQPIPDKVPLEHRTYGDGSDEWVFVPIPVVRPWSSYSFPRLQLVSPSSFNGTEVSPFTP